MKQLSEGEKAYFRDLQDNFDKHVEEYRKKKEAELAEGKKEELQQELEKLESYYQGCKREEISDLLINIDFCGAKVDVLKGLLKE